MKHLIAAIFLISIPMFSQMRNVDELINKTEPGWPVVAEWIKSAKNKVEVLPVDTLLSKEILYKTQVTTRSPMGAIVYMTGGILVDNGWVRILGSGNEKLKRTLPDWNKGKSFKEFGDKSNFYLIADDAIGGFFAINSGAFGDDLGKIYYFAPDSLEFEPLDITYSEFLNFCFSGDLENFYKDNRWKSWKEDVSKLSGEKVFNFYPYLWTKEGKNIEKNSRKIISIEEQYNFNIDMKKQLNK